MVQLRGDLGPGDGANAPVAGSSVHSADNCHCAIGDVAGHVPVSAADGLDQGSEGRRYVTAPRIQVPAPSHLEGWNPMLSVTGEAVPAALCPEQRWIKALYTGGTLAAEAAMLLEDSLGPTRNTGRGHEVIDLGDDVHTGGGRIR